MYEAGSSNFYAEIGSFNELNYASSTDDAPARKKRCGLTAFSGLPKEQTQTSGTCDQLLNGDTSTIITAPIEIDQESPLSSIGCAKQANVAKQKKESDNGVAVSPAEEVLGSVTTFYPAGHPENGHTLRTSARVKHKMRMETIHNAPASAERKEQPKANNAALAKTPNQQKQLRVVWSNHDKNLFFEALNEYGKDFEAILNYLNTKKRRKDNACEQQVFKTKDVRILYYQFNQKISKYLHFSEEVKKEAQELYALINYGEMRKKMPFQNKKYFSKLKDLVYKGFTMVREKGKTIRIKTPSCRALRKLNQLEEWQEEIKLPSRVDVMLQPANMEAWGRVQSLAQNPRVRITVNIQKRLSALLQLFQQKWRSNEVRLIERVEKMKTASATITSKLMRQRMQNEIQFCSQLIPPAPPPTPASTEIVGPILNLHLHFVPSHSAVIHRPLISLATEFQSNTSICLNSYEQRIGVKVRGETLGISEKSTGGTCRKSKLCSDVGSDPTKDEKQVVEQLTKFNINEFLKSPNASNESIELKEIDWSGHGARSGDECDGLSPTAHAYTAVDASPSVPTVGSDPALCRLSDNSNDEFVLPVDNDQMKFEMEMLGDHAIGEEDTVKDEHIFTVTNTFTTCVTTVTTTTTTTAVRKKCTRRKGSDASKAGPGVFNHLRPLISDQEMQRIRDGWTLSNAGDLTIGDLYIMFGEDMKLHLEYDWVWEEATLPRTTAPLDAKLCAAENDEPTNAAAAPVVSGEQLHKIEDFSNANVTLPVEDGTCTGDGNFSGIKDEPSTEVMSDKDGVNMISKRLKQLLMLVNMGTKSSKKKCICANAVERKPKRNDCDNNIPTSQDDNLLFKQPMLPARTGTSYETPIPMHMPTHVRYKQSRWWRTRINRHQGQYPLLPAPRTPHAASDIFYDIAPDAIAVPNVRESTSRVPIPHSITVKSGKGSDASALSNISSSDTNDSSLGINYKEQLLHEEKNANDVGASAPFELASDSKVNEGHQTNPMSSKAPSVGGFDAQQTPVEVANDKSSTTATTLTTTESLSSTAASAALPQNDDSCLSLFDLSLPSTSSSLMANIFSTTATESGVDSGLTPSSPVDAKLYDIALNDISLTSFFGQLDAVYQNEAVAHNQPTQSANMYDLDISTMSETSVDYIARFESIASELRAQGEP